MSNDVYHFTVSEVLKDNRVIVVIYTRVGQSVNMVMDIYDNETMKSGERALDVHLHNGLISMERHDDE